MDDVYGACDATIARASHPTHGTSHTYDAPRTWYAVCLHLNFIGRSDRNTPLSMASTFPPM